MEQYPTQQYTETAPINSQQMIISQEYQQAVYPVVQYQYSTNNNEARSNYVPNETTDLPILPPILQQPVVVQPQVQQYGTPIILQPAMPQQPIQQVETIKTGVNEQPSIYSPQQDNKPTAIVKKGTKFRVRLQSGISDKIKEGTKISFVSVRPVMKRYMTIHTGTIFKALVTDSHSPQISGNGGLIVLKIDEMIANGKSYSIHGKVTKANNKNIFVNNIKGERKYIDNVIDSTDPGYSFYKKSMSATSVLTQNPWTFILTPFPIVAGICVYGGNIILSPVLGAFGKGGNISIPAGTEFEIKLIEDLYIN
ncbi:MAG: hypothetical protein R3Y28_07140 [Candidatus Gastranaerophilales bacterium]